MKLVYFLPWDDDPIAPLSETHPDVSFVRAATKEDAIRELKDAEIFVVGGSLYKVEVASAVKSGAPKLRWIQTASIGADPFVREGVPEHVVFTTAAGLKGTAVSEHGFAIYLALVHAVPAMERFRAAGEWNRNALRKAVNSVEGMTALVVGYGSIGKEIARKAKAFDMEVIAVNRSGEGGPPADAIHTIAELDALLPKADAVLLSLPMTADTDRLFGQKQFAAMKGSAVFVNVGRGQTVDQVAMVQALKQKQIAAAALDVFEEEPLPADDPLWQMPNVILSPHIAGTGEHIYQLFADLVSQNLNRLKTGEELVNQEKV